MNTTLTPEKAAEDEQKKLVQEIVRKTDHIGKRYADGAPNNSRQSTVDGMMTALDLILKGHPESVK